MGCANSTPAVQQTTKPPEPEPQPYTPAPAPISKALTNHSTRSGNSEGSARVSFDMSSQDRNRGRRQSVEVSHRKIVDVFYQKVKENSKISFFFDDMDMIKLKRKQEKLMVIAFSDGEGLADFDLGATHKRLIQERGFTIQHWETFVDLFEETLKELLIPKIKVDNVMNFLKGTRSIFEAAIEENQV